VSAAALAAPAQQVLMMTVRERMTGRVGCSRHAATSWACSGAVGVSPSGTWQPACSAAGRGGQGHLGAAAAPSHDTGLSATLCSGPCSWLASEHVVLLMADDCRKSVADMRYYLVGGLYLVYCG